MTMYLTGLDLTAELTRLGLHCVDQDPDDPTFESADPATISGAQALLLTQGYVFAGSRTRRANVYMTLFRSPGNASPRFVELLYVNERYALPFLALCYVGDGRLIQFRLPYQTFVVDANSQEATDFVDAFKIEVGRDVTFYWVPILKGSKLVTL